MSKENISKCKSKIDIDKCVKKILYNKNITEDWVGKKFCGNSKTIADKLNGVAKQLKEFQKATVSHVYERFLEQDRILVADEVGLGKTMIAKGTIAAMLLKHVYSKGNKPFKVVYICSNHSIAKQNISKLDVLGNNTLIRSRLSSLHFEIEKIKDCNNKSPLELIALTPSTSFDLGRGEGNAWERALIYNTISHLKLIKSNNIKKIDRIFKGRAKKNWGNYKKNIEKEFKNISKNELYIKDIEKFLKQEDDYNKIKKQIKEGQCKQCLVKELRGLFAKYSINNLNPDLVILDEFQRYSNLINYSKTDGEVDENIIKLASEFFEPNKNSTNKSNPKVLLLSATPYKLYNTFQEETSDGSAMDEFFKVVEFLKNSDINEFKNNWEKYTASLKKLSPENIKDVSENLKIIEKDLYQFICRTERQQLIGQNLDNKLESIIIEINKEDILSYYQVEKLCRKMQDIPYINVDYIKSSPWPLSFITNKYKIKEKISEFYNKNNIIKSEEPNLLWIENEEILKRTEEVPNAKFRQFKNIVFGKENNSTGIEYLLWVPPSKPYYKFDGVYKDYNNNDFSKYLVFSKWEFVPRMISILFSIESSKKYIDDEDKSGRLRWTESNKKGSKCIFTYLPLLYPSKALVNLYNPFDKKY